MDKEETMTDWWKGIVKYIKNKIIKHLYIFVKMNYVFLIKPKLIFVQFAPTIRESYDQYLFR